MDPVKLSLAYIITQSQVLIADWLIQGIYVKAIIILCCIGFCQSNAIGIVQCEALFQSQGGFAVCATDFMIQNCCLYCSQVTVATTTPGPTVSLEPKLCLC